MKTTELATTLKEEDNETKIRNLLKISYFFMPIHENTIDKIKKNLYTFK